MIYKHFDPITATRFMEYCHTHNIDYDWWNAADCMINDAPYAELAVKDWTPELDSFPSIRMGFDNIKEDSCTQLS